MTHRSIEVIPLCTGGFMHRTIKGELEPQTHRFGTSAQGRTAYLPVRPSAVQAVITRENGITENFRGRTV